MNLLSSLRSLVTALVNRGRIENDTDEELRAHVQNRADDLEHSGLTRAEAERRARIEFGGHEKFREECRETGGGNLVQVLIQDSRYALRILRRTPLVTAGVAVFPSPRPGGQHPPLCLFFAGSPVGLFPSYPRGPVLR